MESIESILAQSEAGTGVSGVTGATGRPSQENENPSLVQTNASTGNWTDVPSGATSAALTDAKSRTVVNGSLRHFYLVEIRTKLSPASPKPFGKVESAKALQMLGRHCASSSRVVEPTKRLIVITLAMICLHSGSLTEEAKALANDFLLDIDTERKILGAYETKDLLTKGDESAKECVDEDKDYAEDWEVLKKGYQSASGSSTGRFGGIVRRLTRSER